MSKKNIKISKITLEIEGQTIEVTPEGAERLYDALGKFFKPSVVQAVIKSYPVIIREYPRPYFEWQYPSNPMWCSSDNTTLENPHGVKISYNNSAIITDKNPIESQQSYTSD